MEILKFFIFDLFGNLIPGIILSYYLITKEWSWIEKIKINWGSKLVTLGVIKIEDIKLGIFLLVSFIVGNGIMRLGSVFCACIKKDETEKELNKLEKRFIPLEMFSKEKLEDYSTRKEKLIQEKKDTTLQLMESKYLLFRSLSIILLGIAVVRLFEIKSNDNIEYIEIIFIFGGAIICWISFVKYWNLTGKMIKIGSEILEEKNKKVGENNGTN